MQRWPIEQLKEDSPDLILLDIGLPDTLGHDLLSRWRNKLLELPIVILSSRTDETGIVKALELGADDYVTKPFGMKELVARIRVALRHKLQQLGERPIFQAGELSVDLVKRIVKVADREVKLSPVEVGAKSKVLQFLAAKAGKSLPIDERDILAALRNRENLGSTGIGAGIAIPHAPVAGVSTPFGFFARLQVPVDFEAVDEQPVDIVCLVLTPPEAGASYLSLLSRIARQLRSTNLLQKVRAAETREQIYAALTEGDQSVTA